MKDLKLDILNRADDDIIDSLVPFSSDDKKTKKRILAMSEKKFAELQRGSESEKDEISVRGVEQYRRPVWYKPLCAAAALVIMAGGFGMFKFMGRTSGRQFAEGDPDKAAATTEAETTTAAETTEAITENTTDITGDASVNLNGHTFEELKGIADSLLPHYIEARNLYSEEYIDMRGEQLKVNSSHFKVDMIYYKLNNPNFSSYDELKNYYGQYFIDPERSFYCFNVGNDLSVLENDENIHAMIEYNGELYVHENLTATVPDYAAVEPIAEKPSQVRENSFEWQRVTPHQADDDYLYGDESYVCIMDMEILKDDDGVWKIASCQPSSTEKDSYDFNSDFPMGSIEKEVSERTNTDYDTVYDTVKSYLKSEYNYTGKLSWGFCDELYDGVEIIEENYVNNKNWMICTCSENLNGGGILILFLDENGTIFGKKITH